MVIHLCYELIASSQFSNLTLPKIREMYSYHQIPVVIIWGSEIGPGSIKCCSGIGPSLLRDKSQNSILWTLGLIPEPHFIDAGIDPGPWLGLQIFTRELYGWANYKPNCKFNLSSLFTTSMLQLTFSYFFPYFLLHNLDCNEW